MLPTTVLVVEDLEGVRELLGEVLGCHGYDVLTAASVPEVEAIRQRVGLGGLDVVITDLRLTCAPHPREGYELIHRWHAVTPPSLYPERR
jgi:CheY-like chemotaxis protein